MLRKVLLGIVVSALLLSGLTACDSAPSTPANEAPSAPANKAPSTPANEAPSAPANKVGASQFTTKPQEITPEGYYVYHIVAFYYVRGEKGTVGIEFPVPDSLYVGVVDVKKNLTIRVDPAYNGTVLIVKHFSDPIFDEADSAELVVRTTEHKEKWLSSIEGMAAAYRKEYEESLQRRDVVPLK